jgi:hypothetical protein
LGSLLPLAALCTDDCKTGLAVIHLTGGKGRSQPLAAVNALRNVRRCKNTPGILLPFDVQLDAATHFPESGHSRRALCRELVEFTLSGQSVNSSTLLILDRAARIADLGLSQPKIPTEQLGLFD